MRLGDEKYCAHPQILSLIQVEAAVARLWIATGSGLAALCLFSLWPPALAGLGACATAVAFLKGISSAGRSAEAEVDRDLSKGSAAEKCWRVQRWANWVAAARLVPGTRCFYRLAHYAVPAGQVGPLHAAALTAVGLCFLAYVSLGLASIGTEIADGGDHPPAGKHGDSANLTETVVPVPDSDPPPNWFPTYAESCPQLPDPLKIGHGLGELFERDGAAKAGCGDHPRPVKGTGAWVAPGRCTRLHEMRSVAVSSPGGTPVILYAAAARFAWATALDGGLIGAEVARPAGGEIDIIETLNGNYAFARQSPSLVQGSENIKWCWEATGVARPFERLAPVLAWLWLELIRERMSWSWPVGNRQGEGDPISFVDLTAQPIASGGCETETICHLDVDNEIWHGESTAYVSLSEFIPYMPADP